MIGAQNRTLPHMAVEYRSFEDGDAGSSITGSPPWTSSDQGWRSEVPAQAMADHPTSPSSQV
uniref:Uncharacterized protein n=1 Tax=Zea mays TaxID=4577 RepID=C0PFC0_MAIZE|nr:unknown [Zea mays]